MKAQEIFPHVYQVSLGFVNVFLVDGDGLTLVDTGVAGSAEAIFAAVRELGRPPEDIRRVVITHLHRDHTGSAAVIQRATGAEVLMHPADAESARAGVIMRATRPGPGAVNGLVHRLMAGSRAAFQPGEPVPVDGLLSDGQEIPGAQGLTVMALPGHTAGHVGLYFPGGGGLLLLGDAASHMLGLGYSFIYEDPEAGRQSLQKVSALQFDTAAFSHGGPIRPRASEILRKKWGPG